MKLKRPRARIRRFASDVLIHTPFAQVVILLVLLWLSFSAMVYVAERASEDSPIDSFGGAAYWGVAAFSTAGIADPPETAAGRFIGGLWIVVGSVIFFGTIVGTVTSYFMRPMQRPHKMIIDTIEYNLEQLSDLSLEEIDLLKETVDTLIEHVERLKEQQSQNVPST